MIGFFWVRVRFSLSVSAFVVLYGNEIPKHAAEWLNGNPSPEVQIATIPNYIDINSTCTVINRIHRLPSNSNCSIVQCIFTGSDDLGIYSTFEKNGHGFLSNVNDEGRKKEPGQAAVLRNKTTERMKKTAMMKSKVIPILII